MASTPAAEAARRGVTLSGDVVVREAVEAETRKLCQKCLLIFINLSLVLIAIYYLPTSPNITLLGCHP
jgi:hypothetical protein